MKAKRSNRGFQTKSSVKAQKVKRPHPDNKHSTGRTVKNISVNEKNTPVAVKVPSGDLDASRKVDQRKPPQVVERAWGKQWDTTLIRLTSSMFPDVFRPGWYLSSKGKQLGGCALENRMRKLAKKGNIAVVDIPQNVQVSVAVTGRVLYLQRWR